MSTERGARECGDACMEIHLHEEGWRTSMRSARKDSQKLNDGRVVREDF